MTDGPTHYRYDAELLTAYEDAEGNLQHASPRTLGILRKLLSASSAKADQHAAASGDPTEALPVVPAPHESYQPPFSRQQRRTWLLGVQLYALATPENWGHGDFGDLFRILEICADTGCGGVGLNPLHALFEQIPDEASPYAPSSRLFINPLYLDLSRLPGYAEKDLNSIGGILQRSAPLMDYAAVAQAKYAAIKAACQRFMAAPAAAQAAAFSEFRQRKGNLLRRFAAFNLLQARHGVNWRHWPEEWQQPDDARIAALAEQESEAIGITEFAQWQCHAQLAACRDYAREKHMPIGLYLDMAVGSHPCGFDAWNDQEVFLQGAAIGAPPDALNAAGQNWGLTAFNPAVLARRAFRPFRDILAAAMEYAGAIRIDHILGLNRFYLIPDGATGRDGAYLRYPLPELLAVLAHESQEWRCLVIGEDLGTVPQGFREQLQAAGIWTYIVALFERDADGIFRDPAAYPYKALATFATHDLPPFAVWAEGKDLETLHSLGMPASETTAKRLKAYSDLMNAIHSHGPECEGTPFERTVALLGTSGSAVIAVALEDIFGLQNQLNVPGTDKEYPNWRHRTAINWPDARAKIAGIAKILHMRAS